MIYKTLIFMLLSSISLAQDKPYCTESSLTQAQAACNNAYGSDLAQICNSLDCVLQCLKEAMLDCQKTDQFFKYDMGITIVRYRAMCEDLEQTNRAQAACNPTFCEGKYLQPSYLNNMRDLYQKGEFVALKELECNRAKSTLNCIPAAPVGPNCTTELEELSKGLQTVVFSMSECGIAQDHQFFQKYGVRDTPCSNPKINYKCLVTPMSMRASKCLKIPGLSTQNSDDLTETVCSDLECNLKCYLDAIGDCYKEEQRFNLDPKVITVVGRAMCDSGQDTLSVVEQCPINNQTCQEEFNTAAANANIQLMNGDYTGYRTELCRAMTNFQSCVDVNVTSTCTASMAERARNIYMVGYSYAACGPQNHAYFTKYGGDVNCDTSGYTRVTIPFITPCVLIVWAMLFL